MAVVNNIDTSWNQEIIWRNIKESVILPEMANSVLCEKTGRPLTYQGLMKTNKKNIWENALANKFGQLMQGVGQRITKGTETIFPIEFKDLPKDQTAAYAKIVVSIRLQKKEPHCA